jgi:hypothetical protein
MAGITVSDNWPRYAGGDAGDALGPLGIDRKSRSGMPRREALTPNPLGKRSQSHIFE